MTADDSRKRERDAQFQREALCWLADVTRYALSLARNEADADDLVQETFLRAYRSWDQYRLGSECRGWLFTICRNAFLRGRARAQREVSSDDPHVEALAAAAIHMSAVQDGQSELFARHDVSDAIDRALGELPETYRDAVILVDVQDQTYEAASEILGVPIGTVRSRLFRGRRLLQESLLTHARDAGFAHAGDAEREKENQ